MTLQPFKPLTAVAAPIDLPNVDTDQLAPVRFLRRPRAEGYADVLFHDLRFTAPGVESDGFILNRNEFRSAKILIGGRAFGVGSSREQAVWALVDYGIRCVIAESFGDIFYNNAVKHGLLLIVGAGNALEVERRTLHEKPGTRLSVDLENQSWQREGGAPHRFEMEAGRKRRLLLGLDEIQLTLQHDAEITTFAAGYRNRRPWLFRSSTQPGGATGDNAGKNA